MSEKERKFLKCESRQNGALQQKYKTALIRSLRQTMEQYRKSVANDIETMSTSNPNEFRDTIKRFGLRKSNSIPVGVYSSITYEISLIPYILKLYSFLVNKRVIYYKEHN